MSDFRQALVGIRKDLVRQTRDPLGLLVFIALPVLVATLLNLAFGGSDGPAPKAHLLVADRDQSVVSGFLTGALGQDALADLLQTEGVEEDEGRAILDKGKATALLVIPDGFGQSFLDGRPDTLRLYTNPAQRILPGIAKEVLEILTTAGGLLREYLDAPLDQIAGSSGASPSDQTVSEVAVAINGLVSGADGYLFPPAIRYERVPADTSSGGGAGQPSMLWIFFPGLLTTVLLFGAQSLSADLWEEREQGTLTRSLGAPVPVRVLLFSKIASAGIVLGGLMAAAMLLGLLVLRLPLRAPLAGGLFMTLAGTTFTVLLMGVHTLTDNRRGAGILITLVVMVLLLGGGSMFPLEAMPAWMLPIARLTPNGWAITRFAEVSAGRTGPAGLLGAAGGLLLLCLAGWGWITWRVRRGWGRAR